MSMASPHILVVDDDEQIRRPLAAYLRQHGFRTSVAADGQQMDGVLAKSRIDLLILDITLPGADGLSICRRIQETSRVPTIFLTARTEDADLIVGLEMGADDYVTKPFNPRELVARVKSVLRRSEMLPRHREKRRSRVRFDRWRFDFARKEIVGDDGVVVCLSSGEHLLLVTLVEHAGTTLSREQLLDLTKGRDAQLFDRSIDNQVSRLRRKLEIDPKHPRIIRTEWGEGYVFVAELEWAD